QFQNLAGHIFWHPHHLLFAFFLPLFAEQQYLVDLVCLSPPVRWPDSYFLFPNEPETKPELLDLPDRIVIDPLAFAADDKFAAAKTRRAVHRPPPDRLFLSDR